MIGLRHDNIGRLIGVSCRERPFYLLTEHYDRGSLRDCLRDGAIPSDNVEALFDVCIQAVAALAYLEAQRYVLHRAVASKNFVVAGDDRLIKLCGFERARRVSDDDYLVCFRHFFRAMLCIKRGLCRRVVYGFSEITPWIQIP